MAAVLRQWFICDWVLPVDLASPKAARAMRILSGRRATQSAILPRPTRLLVREELAKRVCVCLRL